MTPLEEKLHKKWKAELAKAEKEPRTLTKEPNDEEQTFGCIEGCVMCAKPTRHWLQPENAPLCSDACMRAYLKNPSVYDPRGLYKGRRPPAQPKETPPDASIPDLRAFQVVATGLEVLSRVLQRLRDDEQGGYPSYAGNGRWGFVSTGLPQVTPDELNALFAAVGIKPDVIQSKGSCTTCMFAKDGHERGYAQPCSGCSRPVMSNYIPKRGLKVLG